MSTNPFTPGYYAPTNQLLLDFARRRAQERAGALYDEASEHALAGNPKRAAWCEYWAARALRGGR